MPLHVFRSKLLILILSITFCVLTPSVDSETCICGCGLSNRNASTHWYNILVPYPWSVRLIYKGHLWCSGSLLNSHYVITAAHCVKSEYQSEIYIVLGDSNTDIDPYRHRSRDLRTVSAVIRHENYDGYDNDVALLKLSNRVRYSKKIRPVCLPLPGADYAGKVGTVIEWDRLSERPTYYRKLPEVQVPILSQAECRYMPHRWIKKFTDNMICAGENDRNACRDGPLLVQRANNKFELAGVASQAVYFSGCGRSRFYAGLYTRVSRYFNWLNANVKQGCLCTN